jgi:TrmH family RNA methyltransferase
VSAPLARGSARLRHLRALVRDAAARRAEAAAVVEGPRLLDAVCRAGARIREVYVDGEAAAGSLAPLLDRARDAGAAVVPVHAGVLEHIGDARSSQGVIAVVDRPAPLDLGRLAAATAEPFVVVASSLGDPGNAGALVRSAAAFGAAGVVLGPGSVDAYNPKTVRASAGALFTIPILEATVEQATTAQILARLRDQGMRCVGADVAGQPLGRTDLAGPVAIVLGHETRGLDPDLPLDAVVRIPMQRRVESLNVAMAGTVLAYEVARRRGGGA